MDAYFFGQRKVVPTEFAEWLAPDVSAAVSIDMHRGHLDDSPECHARRHVRARSSSRSTRFIALRSSRRQGASVPSEQILRLGGPAYE
jgi:hypothetical protein